LKKPVEYSEEASLESYTLSINANNMNFYNIGFKDMFLLMLEKIENVISGIAERVPINCSLTFNCKHK